MLKEKTAFITGTNRGIGKAIVQEFAKNGANIIAHARRETPEFSEFLKQLSQQYGVEILPVYFDMTDHDAMKSVIMDIRAKKISIDALVNNAGILYNSSFQMSSTKALHDVFEVNFFSTFLLTQYISNLMVRQKHGSIVTISSIGAISGHTGKAVYGASKAALITMSRVIANELGQFGVRANCIAPGVINTDMSSIPPESELEKARQNTPLKRFGNPCEVAQVAAFLASDASSFVNGQTIRVDGGFM